MEKSKLGISIALFGALLFFLGAAGSVLAIAVAAGYVLYFEENTNLKKTAVKALILTVFLAILTLFINWLVMFSINSLQILSSYNTYSGINYTGDGYYRSDFYTNPYLYQFLQSIPQIISNIMRILEIIILVIFGFRAYKQKELKIKWIDKILDKHLS